MDPVSNQAEAAAHQPQFHEQHQPAHQGEDPLPAHASAPEQLAAPLSAPQAPEEPSHKARAALTGPEVLDADLKEPAYHEAPMQQHPVPRPPQAPAAGSYEALAAFSSPVGTEMPGAGLHHDAQDQQPVQETGDHALAQPAPPGADSTHSDYSQVKSEAMQAGMLKQEQPKQAVDAPAAEFPAHNTEPALPFHPEQSLQEVQHAADDQMMHDAGEKAGTAAGMHAERPDEEMTAAAEMPEGGRVNAQSEGPSARYEQSTELAIPGHQQGAPQQTRQPQSAPAVRTLDDIMSQFEGMPQPPLHPFSAPIARREGPTEASESPVQAHAHQHSAGGHGVQVHAAHADQNQDQDMLDAMEAGTPQAVAETPEGPLLQGKGSAKGGAARRQEIKPETDAGSVVWAKTKGYPWWPAQVLALEDPWIPPDMEIPRRGAVPVRFFGTYNFTWIESQRNLMAFDQGCQDDLPSKCNTKVFQDGLGEAQRYLDTGESPAGFSTMPASPEVAPEEASTKPGKRPGSAKAREGGPGGPGISKDAGKVAAARKKEAEKAAAARAAALQRRQRALKKLGLVPPRGSPYAEEPCLDVARAWFAQALVEESARQQKAQQDQRQEQERQRVQQAMIQRQLAAQMLHQQQLLQRVAAQQVQQGGQEALPNVWRPNQAFANALATSAAQQQQQQQVPGHYQAPAEGQQ